VPDLQPVDMATHPYLSGRFAPIAEEIEATDLEVEGTLPEGLVGAYLRNGPNEMFPPLGSYSFPMEGDAMVHGVWLDVRAALGTRTGGCARRGWRPTSRQAATSSAG
jgi:carotenoid cleavage dioxygenase-like enzyme